MRQSHSSILIIISLLFALNAVAQKQVPKPLSSQFPNIRASLDDGFFALAEQQARGVLRGESTEEQAREAVLLLSHALWGQKRYSEMLELLKAYNGEPGYVYWRARAHFELKQYEGALKALEKVDNEMLLNSRYAPSILRLKGFVEQKAGKLDAAVATYKQFAKDHSGHRERIENQFDLAEVYTLQERFPAAIAVYEMLSAEKNKGAVQRADLKRAHLLYTEGPKKNVESARHLLTQLATNKQTRLAYRIDAYVDLAALENKDGKKDESVGAMRKGISLSPDARQRVPLKLALARMLLADDDTKGALKLLEECRAEAPNETIAAELQLEKSKALLQAKRFAEAEEGFQVYLDVANDSEGLAQAYYGKGLALWELERYAESASVFDKAVKALKDPSAKSDALFKSGDAYYKAEKLEDAEKRYRSFVVDFPTHQNLPNALYQLGLCLAKIGRRPEALTTFGILETNHASSPFAKQAALRSADVILANHQWEEALAKFTQIGQTYTNTAVAALSLHQRGLVLYQLGRYADAQLAFETVIAEYPDSEYVPQASYMRGFCLYMQGQPKEAVDTCKAFIEKYPDSKWTPEVIFWLAEQYFNQGRYADAEPLFQRIFTDFKGHALAPRALYWAGRASAAQSNYVKAIELYSEVAKSYASSDILPQTRFAQGDALTELGQFAQAILAFEEIIKNYPESYLVNAAWGRKGDCQFSLAADTPSRYAEAMNSYQAILDRPSAPMALKLQTEYKIGRCFEKTGAPDTAFNRYMNVVYTFINESVEHSPYSVMWFTRSAFGAATIKEKAKAWPEAVQVYERVVEADVPAKEEALKRIEKIKTDNWLLFQ